MLPSKTAVIGSCEMLPSKTAVIGSCEMLPSKSRGKMLLSMALITFNYIYFFPS